AYAIGLHRQHVGGRRLRRHQRDVATLLHQQAQDVLLHAEVVGDDLVLCGRLAERLPVKIVRTFAPRLPLTDADHLREVNAIQAGKRVRLRDRLVGIDGITRHDAAVLRTAVAQYARELAGVDVRD